MTFWLSILVVGLLAAAIAIQVYYVRGLRKAGVEVTRATRVVVWVNVTLLVIVGLGVLAFGVVGGLTEAGM